MPEVFTPAGGAGGRAKAKRAYAKAFGNLPDGTVYQDPLGIHGKPGHDLRPALAKAWEPEYKAIGDLMQDGATFREATKHVAIEKALTTGDLTLPVFPQEDLTMVAAKRTPFFEMLPKVTAETNTVDQDSVTALGTPEVGGETDVPSTANDDTIGGQSLSMTFYRIRGEVSGPVQLAASTLRNSINGEQQRKAMAMRHFGEDLVLNGTATSGTTDGSVDDERGYKGIIQLAQDNSRNRNPDAGTGTTITVEEVRDNLRRATDDGGDPSTCVSITDNKTLFDLKNELDDHDPVEVDGPEGTISLGARSVVIDGHPVVVSDQMPTTANSRAFATVDMRFHRVHRLSDLVMEALGKTSDSDDFFMKVYEVMEQANGADKYTALLENLA